MTAAIATEPFQTAGRPPFGTLVPSFVPEWWKIGAPNRMKLGTPMWLLFHSFCELLIGTKLIFPLPQCAVKLLRLPSSASRPWEKSSLVTATIRPSIRRRC